MAAAGRRAGPPGRRQAPPRPACRMPALGRASRALRGHGAAVAASPGAPGRRAPPPAPLHAAARTMFAAACSKQLTQPAAEFRGRGRRGRRPWAAASERRCTAQQASPIRPAGAPACAPLCPNCSTVPMFIERKSGAVPCDGPSARPLKPWLGSPAGPRNPLDCTTYSMHSSHTRDASLALSRHCVPAGSACGRQRQVGVAALRSVCRLHSSLHQSAACYTCGHAHSLWKEVAADTARLWKCGRQAVLQGTVCNDGRPVHGHGGDTRQRRCCTRGAVVSRARRPGQGVAGPRASTRRSTPSSSPLRPSSTPVASALLALPCRRASNSA